MVEGQVNLTTLSKGELKQLLVQTENDKGKNSAQAQEIRNFISSRKGATRERLPQRRFGFNVDRVKQRQKETLSRRQSARGDVTKGKTALAENEAERARLEKQSLVVGDALLAKKLATSGDSRSVFGLKTDQQKKFFNVFREQELDQERKADISKFIAGGFLAREGDTYVFTEKGLKNDEVFDESRFIKRPEVITVTTTPPTKIFDVRSGDQDVQRKIKGKTIPQISYDIVGKGASKITKKIIPSDAPEKVATVIGSTRIIVRTPSGVVAYNPPVFRFLGGLVGAQVKELREKPIKYAEYAGLGKLVGVISKGAKVVAVGASSRGVEFAGKFIGQRNAQTIAKNIARRVKTVGIIAGLGVGAYYGTQTAKKAIEQPSIEGKGAVIGVSALEVASFSVGFGVASTQLTRFQKSSLDLKVPVTKLQKGRFETGVRSFYTQTPTGSRVDSVVVTRFISRKASQEPVQYIAFSQGLSRAKANQIIDTLTVGRSAKVLSKNLTNIAVKQKTLSSFVDQSLSYVKKVSKNVFKSVGYAKTTRVNEKNLYRVGKSVSGKVDKSIFTLGKTRRLGIGKKFPDVIIFADGRGSYIGEATKAGKRVVKFNKPIDLKFNKLFKPLDKKGATLLKRPTPPIKKKSVDAGEVGSIQLNQVLKTEALAERDLRKKFNLRKQFNINVPLVPIKLDTPLKDKVRGRLSIKQLSKSLTKEDSNLKFDLGSKSTSKTKQTLKTLQLTTPSTQTINTNTRPPISSPPVIPKVIPTTIIPPPFPLRSKKKKKKKDKTPRFKDDLFIVPDFTSRALNLKTTIPKSKLKEFASKGKTGLELRRIPVIK